MVLDMTAGLQGHNITCDNFFTSYDLGQELLRRKLTMVGRVKKNKPELPAEILQVKDRAPLSSKFAFTDTTTAVSYCPKRKRNVILMSTLHKDAAVSSGSDKKPSHPQLQQKQRRSGQPGQADCHLHLPANDQELANGCVVQHP